MHGITKYEKTMLHDDMLACILVIKKKVEISYSLGISGNVI